MAYTIKRSHGDVYKKYAIKSFATASNILTKAKMFIFSCAIINALKGTMIRPNMNVIIEQCSTQLAAYNLSKGMFIL